MDRTMNLEKELEQLAEQWKHADSGSSDPVANLLIKARNVERLKCSIELQTLLTMFKAQRFNLRK